MLFRLLAVACLLGLTQHLSAKSPQPLNAIRREEMVKLGDREYAAGRIGTALEPYRSALRLVDEKKEPVVWSRIAMKVAQVLQRQERHAEAEELVRKALDFLSTNLGANHPDTLAATHNLSVLRATRGDQAEALRLAQLAVDGALTGLPGDSAERAIYEKHLARLKAAAGTQAKEKKPE